MLRGFLEAKPSNRAVVSAIDDIGSRLKGELDLLLLSGKALERAGALTKAAGAYRQALRINRKSRVALRGLLRVCLQRYHFRFVRWLLDGALSRSNHEQVLLARVRLALLDRDPNKASAILENLNSTSWQAQKLRGSAQLLSDRLAWRPSHDFRHIAIGGISFCGSTVLSSLLGSVDGVFNVGESHHMIERSEPKQVGQARNLILGGGLFQWGKDDPDSLFPCHSCGPRCEVFDDRFRQQLASAPAGWYGKIAAQAGARVLVSSDKNSIFLQQKDPLSDYDLVLLYKSPSAAWASELKNKERLRRMGLDRPDLHRLLQDYLTRWSSNYLALLRGMRPTGSLIVMSWDGFCSLPEEHWARLLSHLGLRSTSDVFGAVKLDQHFFGGNVDIRSQELAGAGAIEISPPAAPELPEEEREEIASHTESSFVFRLLQFHYRRRFGDIASRGAF